jgi:hypothetical protein
MLRYKSTGATRCSAIVVRAIRARAPVISRRPPAEQKIHTGKKEPKMLYSGAWEQPTNTSGAIRDKPARRRGEVIRRRSRSVDSVFMSGRPYTCRILVLIALITLSIQPKRTSFPAVDANPTTFRARYGMATNPLPATLNPDTERSVVSLSFTFRLSHKVKNRIYWTKVSNNTFASDNVYRYFGIDQYVRPIDSAPHFCPNPY